MILFKHWKSVDTILFLRNLFCLLVIKHFNIWIVKGSLIKDMEWVDFFQIYTYVLKHINGNSNRVVDALSRRHSFLLEMHVEVVDFNDLKEMHEGDPYFGEAWRVCKEPIAIYMKKWLDYLIQDGNKLCISRSSMRMNLIKEKHSGGLAWHFGFDKSITLVGEQYFGLNCSKIL